MAKEKENKNKDPKADKEDAARKEREQRRKDYEERRKKFIKKEQKKINAIVSFPYRVLLTLSAIAGILGLLYTYFWAEMSILKSLMYAFGIFVILYLGFGIILTVVYYIISESKIKILSEQLLEEEKRKNTEDKYRHSAEFAELEQMEKHVEESFKGRSDSPEVKPEQKPSPQQQSQNNREASMEDEYLEELLNKEFFKQENQ